MKKNQIIHFLIPASVLKGNYGWTTWRYQQSQHLGIATQPEWPGPR